MQEMGIQIHPLLFLLAASAFCLTHAACSAVLAGAAGSSRLARRTGLARAARGVNITVPTGAPIHPGRPSISPAFASLSMEVGSAEAMLIPAVSNVLLAIFTMTGSPHEGPVIRIGGNSADRSCWRDYAPRPAGCRCDYEIGPEDLTRLEEFRGFPGSTKLNATFVFGVNFGCGSSGLAAAHVRAMAAQGLFTGGRNVPAVVSAVEVGNEVDRFAGTYRPANWTFDDYDREFVEFADALGAAGLPHSRQERRLQGAVFCDLNTSFSSRLGQYAQDHRDRLGSVSFHAYSLHGGSKPLLLPEWPARCNESSTAYHIDALLSTAASAEFAQRYEGIAAAIESAGLPFVVGEGNTESAGGWHGMSDTVASALWAVDWLPEISKRGAVRENLHGGPGGFYPPIAVDAATGLVDVRPMYYGVLAFSELVANYSKWTETVIAAGPPGDSNGTGQGNEDVVAHAAVDRDGRLSMLVAVKGLERAVAAVTVPTKFVEPAVASTTAAAPALSATLVRLEVAAASDPSLDPADATGGVTWGAQSFDNSTGSLMGNRHEQVVQGMAVDGGRNVMFRVPVERRSVVVIKFGR